MTSAKTWTWSIDGDQWSYVMFFTAYCGLAGAQAGNPWIGLVSFPVWWGIAAIG